MFAANSVQHQSSSGGSSNFGGTVYGYGTGFVSSAEVVFNTDGSIVGNAVDSTITNTVSGDNWYAPNKTGIGSSYWVRVTVVSGTLSGGSDVNVWLSLSSTRSWFVYRTTDGTSTVQLFIEISSSVTGSPVVASGTVYLQAQINTGSAP